MNCDAETEEKYHCCIHGSTQAPAHNRSDARIALVDKQIQRLETLNANRRELIAKTEEKLNQRKEALCKSEAMLKCTGQA